MSNLTANHKKNISESITTILLHTHSCFSWYLISRIHTPSSRVTKISNPLKKPIPLSCFNFQRRHLPSLTLSMATETENPSTAAAATTVEDNPGKTLDMAVPASTNTASSTVDSATEGPKQDADNSKSASPATDTEKKIRRAERFGITVQLSEQEKRNSRAERFGTSQRSESDSVKKSEELKRKARAERFGIPVPPTATEEEAKKKARLERFAPAPKIDALEEDKRKARALRFSQSSSGSLSMNGSGDHEPKAAIAGNAGGVS